MGVKPIPPMGIGPSQVEPPSGYRGRYDAPPFEDIPPGVEPSVPGFEPSPFEKPLFGPAGPIDRDRIPPLNYRDPYRPPPYVEGPGGYRDISMAPAQNDISVHVGDQPPRYRESYRPGHSYREQGTIPYRDGQPYRDPGQPAFRDSNFRGGPPPFRDNSYRNHPYRDGSFRENPPHNFRDGAFRPPSADSREVSSTNFNDPNYRDNFRDETSAGRDHLRSNYRPSTRNRGGPRRNPNIEHDRHKEREGRDRERYNENRDISERIDRARDTEKRPGYEKSVREDRPREYERSREYDKERERDHDKTTPDKKARVSPKRREAREKRRSESRGRSRDRERDSRREKKDERVREKSSADRSREHKDKDKKLKDKKKKKREKEKDNEKKKKREKKEKKDKEVKKEDLDVEKSDIKKDVKESNSTEPEKLIVKTEIMETTENITKKDDSPTQEPHKSNDDLYGEEAAEAVDKDIIQNYVKTEGDDVLNGDNNGDSVSKEEPFDGIELQAPVDELELKADIEGTNQDKEMLAPLPELSKWEVDDETVEKSKESGEITSPEEEEDGGKVTSEVIKRAENAIFAKAINSLRPIEIKKISNDRLKLYGDEAQPKSSIQITVPVIDSEERSIEINDRKKRYSKTPPPRLSVKERLGGKVEDIRKPKDTRIVQSTVERVKSRSKTPKKEQLYRRVTVDKDRSRKSEILNRFDLSKSDKRLISEAVKAHEKYRSRSSNDETKKKASEKNIKEEKKSKGEENTNSRGRGHEKNGPAIKVSSTDRERKKSILDEAHFEPDYDETVESDNDVKDDSIKKHERSMSPTGPSESKRAKLDTETIKLDLTNVKKKPDTESETSSDSEDSSSSSSSDGRKRKKKKKRNKKKKKRAASDSDSESDTSSDDHKKKKKKRKHKKKSSKKKKKSKHK